MLKKIMRSKPAACLFQAAVMLLLSAIAALFPLLLPAFNLPLKIVLQWIALPAAGLLTSVCPAYAGINKYLSWLAPPVLVSAVPWLIVGYPLAPGIMLACCLTSMIGASAGEIAAQRAQKKEK